MKNFIGVIPARYKSTRYPGKPLCDINGKPMIWHVYQQALKWKKFDEIYVAVDDVIVEEACRKLNIPCIMTDSSHKDCLDRAYEVSERLRLTNKGAQKYVILQGDEPLFNADTLNVDLNKPCINFYTVSTIDVTNTNSVKVVVNLKEKALYFSRFPIPYQNVNIKRSSGSVPIYKQIGVYVFTGEMLKTYYKLGHSQLENAEGIGLNRLLDHDFPVYMRFTQYDSISVDTPKDRETILKILNERAEV